MPATFGLADSIARYSSGAWAPAPWPRPNIPAGSLSGAPVNVTPGHEPASRGQSNGSIPLDGRSRPSPSRAASRPAFPSGRIRRSCSLRRRQSPASPDALDQVQRSFGGHVRNEPHIDLGDARFGKIVLPPGPVYPPTSPSMLMVGCETSRTSESCHDSSPNHRDTLNAFLAAASSRRGIACSRISLSCGLSGRTPSKKPSTAGVWPSAPTSV